MSIEQLNKAARKAARLSILFLHLCIAAAWCAGYFYKTYNFVGYAPAFIIASLMLLYTLEQNSKLWRLRNTLYKAELLDNESKL